MTRSVGLFLLLSLALSFQATAQKLGEVPVVEPGMKAAKGKVLQWKSAQGRDYWYRLPKKSPSAGPNLIFMFHGTGGNHGWSFWNYPIGSNGFRPNDIVVSPEGMTPGQGSTFNFVQNKNDEEQIVGLIKNFKSRFKINKVFLYGHSQGAFFAYWFAGQQPKLVDGFIAHAGNLLANVAHPKFARENLAVAILHGRADAVVPVSCATSSHEAYKKMGYRRLKLEIVEGLNERTGHWPLPAQVSQLFLWLDKVSTSSADSAVQAFEDELKAKNPSLESLQILISKSETLIKKYRGKDKKDVAARIAEARKTMDELCGRAAKLVTDHPVDPKKKEDQLGYAIFRRLHQILENEKAWQKAMGPKWISGAKKDTKYVAKILKSLKKKHDAKSDKKGRAALSTHPRTPLHNDLSEFLSRAVSSQIEIKNGSGVKRGTELKVTNKTRRLNKEAAELISKIPIK